MLMRYAVDGEVVVTLGTFTAIDVILCHMMMPVVTGMDFYDQLLQKAREQAERIVFLTSGAFTVRARELLDRVPNARIAKPFEVQNLRALARRAAPGLRRHDSSALRKARANVAGHVRGEPRDVSVLRNCRFRRISRCVGKSDCEDAVVEARNGKTSLTDLLGQVWKCQRVPWSRDRDTFAGRLTISWTTGVTERSLPGFPRPDRLDCTLQELAAAFGTGLARAASSCA
jgi:CheY-like chemotaxis protein